MNLSMMSEDYNQSCLLEVRFALTFIYYLIRIIIAGDHLKYMKLKEKYRLVNIQSLITGHHSDYKLLLMPLGFVAQILVSGGSET